MHKFVGVLDNPHTNDNKRLKVHLNISAVKLLSMNIITIKFVKQKNKFTNLFPSIFVHHHSV